jgi:hypothetical protein
MAIGRDGDRGIEGAEHSERISFSKRATVVFQTYCLVVGLNRAFDHSILSSYGFRNRLNSGKITAFTSVYSNDRLLNKVLILVLNSPNFSSGGRIVARTNGR